MEVARVYLNLYTDRCGDKGRIGIDSLKIDTAPVLFPVAETRGLRSSRSADLARSRAGRRSVSGGFASRLGGKGFGTLAIGRRHTHLVCQNSRPPATNPKGKQRATSCTCHGTWSRLTHSVCCACAARTRAPSCRVSCRTI